MTYRIRYRRLDARSEAEMVVEAGSPAEAMIKFQCSWDGPAPRRYEDVVTSVRAEESYRDFRG
jgi:hypothetical protein